MVSVENVDQLISEELLELGTEKPLDRTYS